MSGIAQPLWNNLRQQIFLGGGEFISKHFESSNEGEGRMRLVALWWRRSKALTLEEHSSCTQARDDAIVALRQWRIHAETTRGAFRFALFKSQSESRKKQDLTPYVLVLVINGALSQFKGLKACC